MRVIARLARNQDPWVCGLHTVEGVSLPSAVSVAGQLVIKYLGGGNDKLGVQR